MLLSPASNFHRLTAMPKFDKEAWRFFFIFLIFALFSILPHGRIGWIFACIFMASAIFSLYFFRDPDRIIPQEPDAIVSPADGKIVFVGEHGLSGFGKTLRIAIFMNLHDVHVNRSPVDGVVEKLEYIEGGFTHAGKGDPLEKNERQIIEIATARGRVIVYQIAGMVARRIVCRLKEKQSISKGERIGLIRFGSRLEVFLPSDKAQPTVKVGDIVRCGESVIARWL